MSGLLRRGAEPRQFEEHHRAPPQRPDPRAEDLRCVPTSLRSDDRGVPHVAVRHATQRLRNQPDLRPGRVLVPWSSAGRTPALWDLNVRFAYPFHVADGVAARATLDWLHVGSPRRPVWLEQFHYVDEDADGNPINPTPTFGQLRSYQPPTQARLGVEFTF